MLATVERLAFVAPAMRSGIIVQDFTPMRIRHRGKNSGSSEQPDRPTVMVDAIPVSPAYYAALVVVFGLL